MSDIKTTDTGVETTPNANLTETDKSIQEIKEMLAEYNANKSKIDELVNSFNNLRLDVNNQLSNLKKNEPSSKEPTKTIAEMTDTELPSW